MMVACYFLIAIAVSCCFIQECCKFRLVLLAKKNKNIACCSDILEVQNHNLLLHFGFSYTGQSQTSFLLPIMGNRGCPNPNINCSILPNLCNDYNEIICSPEGKQVLHTCGWTLLSARGWEQQQARACVYRSPWTVIQRSQPTMCCHLFEIPIHCNAVRVIARPTWFIDDLPSVTPRSSWVQWCYQSDI